MCAIESTCCGKQYKFMHMSDKLDFVQHDVDETGQTH